MTSTPTTSREDYPLPKYRWLSVATIKRAARDMSPEQLKNIREHEVVNQNRKTLLAILDRMINKASKTWRP